MTVKARGSSALRTVRRLGGKVIRRLGMLPSGTPDGLGEDAQLLGRTLPYEIMVYFADTTDALYQIEQWYSTFRALNEKHPLVIVLRDSRTARYVRADSGLPVLVIAHYTTIDDLLSRSDVKLALYVNHNPENFSNLRFGQLMHASLMHGDSDKTVTVSNQTKAYDFSFVAGRAAVERMGAYTALYDAEKRCIPVGRPQVDEQEQRRAQRAARRQASERRSVLYAPTWEGAQVSAAYGSVASHGCELVRRILASQQYRVIYRPHPLTGVRDAEYGDADRRIREMIAQYDLLDPAAGHRVDVDVDIAESFADSDILLCDVSGVAMDWLPSGNPMIMMRPSADEVIIAETRLTALIPSVTSDKLDGLLGLIREHLDNDPLRAKRQELTEYYLGDVRPGAATRRFIEACEEVMRIGEKERDRIQWAGQVGAQPLRSPE